MADFVWKQPGRYWNSRGTNELDATPSAPDCRTCVNPVAPDDVQECTVPDMYLPGTMEYGDLPIRAIASSPWSTDDTIVAPPASPLPSQYKTSGHVQTRNMLHSLLEGMVLWRVPGAMLWRWQAGTPGYDGPRTITRTLDRRLIQVSTPVPDQTIDYGIQNHVWSHTGSQEIELTSVGMGWLPGVCTFSAAFTMNLRSVTYGGGYPDFPGHTVSNDVRNWIVANRSGTFPNPLTIYPGMSEIGFNFNQGGPRSFPYSAFGTLDTIDDPSFPPFGLPVYTRFSYGTVFGSSPDLYQKYQLTTGNRTGTYGPGETTRQPLKIKVYYRWESSGSHGNRVANSDTWIVPPPYAATVSRLWNPEATVDQLNTYGTAAFVPVPRNFTHVDQLTGGYEIPTSSSWPQPTYVFGFGIQLDEQ